MTATILFLHKDSLFLLSEELQPEKLLFPQDLVVDMVIKDKKLFSESLETFLSTVKIPSGTITIFLGKDVVSDKLIPFTSKEEIKVQAEAFFSSLPVSTESIAKKTLSNSKEVYCVAANKEFYETIAEVFMTHGWKVDHVVPVTFFTKDEEVSNEKLISFLKKSDMIELIDFLEENPLHSEKKKVEEFSGFTEEVITSEEPKPQMSASSSGEDFFKDLRDPVSPSKKNNLQFFGLIFFVTLLLAFGVLFLMQYGPHLMSKMSPTPTPTSVPTQVPTPTIAFIQKADMKIQIQNGTGTPGQAKKVGDALSKLGYQNITTANASNTNATQTTVTVLPTVSPDVRTEIKTALSKLFTQVTLQESPQGDYQVVIVTGPTQ